MDVILVPGLWLDASSWDAVVPALRAAGHDPHPLTLPGMATAEADRVEIGLPDNVEAVVAAIDSLGTATGAAGADGRIAGKVALVAHSAGGGVAHAAVDARPDRIAHVVYVGGFPTPDGSPIAGDFAVRNGDIPLPDWSEFDAADLLGLDEAALADFRGRAVPSPARLTSDLQQLSDVRRYEVPVTVIATEFDTATLRSWIAGGMEPVQEFPNIRDVSYLDLPTGHWPQFTRPADLAAAIVAAIAPENPSPQS